MAIKWGSAAGSGSGQFKLGYSFSQSPSTIPGGAGVTVTITCKIYVWTKYNLTDSNNTLATSGSSGMSSSGSVSIATSVGSGSGWSSSNQKLIKTLTRTFTSSSSAVTTSVTATLTGLEAAGSSAKASVSGSWTTPAIPITNAHPVITLDDYNYGDSSATFVLDYTGGANFTVTGATVSYYNDRLGTTSVGTFTPTRNGTPPTLGLAAGDITTLLNYWENTAKEITKLTASITTQLPDATTKVHTVTLTPDSLANLYTLTSFTAMRNKALNKQDLVAVIATTNMSPFAQASMRWPAGALKVSFTRKSPTYSLMSTDATGVTVTYVDDQGITRSSYDRSFSISDSPSLGDAVPGTYTVSVVQGGTTAPYYREVYLPPTDSFMAMRMADGTYPFDRLGINNGSPTEALDVKGNIKASGTVKTSGLEVTGSITGMTHLRYTLDTAQAMTPDSYTVIKYNDLEYDAGSSGAYNTTTGVFTAPATGYYLVTAGSATGSATTWNAEMYYVQELHVSGAGTYGGNRWISMLSDGSDAIACSMLSTVIKLNQGQTFTVGAACNKTSNFSLHTNPSYNFLTVDRIA